jgi:hypothetical protein
VGRRRQSLARSTPEEFKAFIAKDFPAQKRLFDISGAKPG